ncbi:MAG: hypothetical protein D6773_14750 [Alphaproteobacteria bacterium]|nr:MAG: hypothetical protein D6773_14750 [Alphaproteobacteria bacterium]
MWRNRCRRRGETGEATAEPLLAAPGGPRPIVWPMPHRVKKCRTPATAGRAIAGDRLNDA